MEEMLFRRPDETTKQDKAKLVRELRKSASYEDFHLSVANAVVDWNSAKVTAAALEGGMDPRELNRHGDCGLSIALGFGKPKVFALFLRACGRVQDYTRRACTYGSCVSPLVAVMSDFFSMDYAPDTLPEAVFAAYRVANLTTLLDHFGPTLVPSAVPWTDGDRSEDFWDCWDDPVRSALTPDLSLMSFALLFNEGRGALVDVLRRHDEWYSGSARKTWICVCVKITA